MCDCQRYAKFLCMAYEKFKFFSRNNGNLLKINKENYMYTSNTIK